MIKACLTLAITLSLDLKKEFKYRHISHYFNFWPNELLHLLLAYYFVSLLK